MSKHFPFSGSFSTAEHDHQHFTFQNQCLKRKLESEATNGFVVGEDLEMCGQEQEYSLISEKRPRFSQNPAREHQFESDRKVNRESDIMNGELSLNYFSSATRDTSSSVAHQENNMGADSLLQNNLEGNASCANEEVTGMDIECDTDGNHCSATGIEGCPPNLNVGLNSPQQSDPHGSNETTPEKGSPAREFLLKHRPEYQMHCIPSYCHPGGLWDVMLEVYHGI